MSSMPELRPLVGTAVTVETSAGILCGTLLSCTNSTLWLVSGEDDVMVPVSAVRTVNRISAA